VQQSDTGYRRWPVARGLWPALAIACAVASIVWLVAGTFREPFERTDFQYVWMAGRVWALGLNPYGSAFIRTSGTIFGAGRELSVWVYPFHWYVPTRIFAAMDTDTALRVWNLVSFAAVGVVIYLLRAVQRRFDPAADRWAFLLGLAFALSFVPVSSTFRLGQPVVFSILGLACILHAMVFRRRALLILGIVLVSLKPQVAIPVLASLMFARHGLRNVAIAGVIAGLFALPAFAAAGFWPQVQGLLHNVSGGYDRLDVNFPIRMIGLPHFMASAAGVDLSMGVSVALATALVMAAMALARRVLSPDDPRFALVLTLANVAAITTIVGVHPADLSLVLLCLPFVALMPIGWRLVSLAGYVLLWRFPNVAAAIGGDEMVYFHLGTISVFLIAAGWVGHGWARWRASPALASA
jgi:hypothetical protein